eukprot:765263-Hanusia_phi.AAC.2
MAARGDSSRGDSCHGRCVTRIAATVPHPRAYRRRGPRSPGVRVTRSRPGPAYYAAGPWPLRDPVMRCYDQ